MPILKSLRGSTRHQIIFYGHLNSDWDSLELALKMRGYLVSEKEISEIFIPEENMDHKFPDLPSGLYQCVSTVVYLINATDIRSLGSVSIANDWFPYYTGTKTRVPSRIQLKR